MVYDFEARHSLLATKMRDNNNRVITFFRRDTDTEVYVSQLANIKATVYEIPNEELINGGIALNFRRQDYFVTAADMESYVPENGDRIIITDSRYPTSTLVAEVCKLGDRPFKEWTSHNRVTMKIHTKVITD